MSPGLLSVIAITTINLALLARWNSSANGETSKITTLCPPLSLNIVALSGVLPNAAMLSRTARVTPHPALFP